jgi:hypothetical protein
MKNRHHQLCNVLRKLDCKVNIKAVQAIRLRGFVIKYHVDSTFLNIAFSAHQNYHLSTLKIRSLLVSQALGK